MAILKIYTYPDDVLKQKCRDIVNLTNEDRTLINDMIETMFASKGVGLAASQVGILKNIIVCSPKVSKNEVYVLVNPVIVYKSGSVIDEEGCLSLPSAEGEVERAKLIKVDAFDKDFNKIVFEAKDFFARIIQHEIDHLNGILFIDHLGFSARKKAINNVLRNDRL